MNVQDRTMVPKMEIASESIHHESDYFVSSIVNEEMSSDGSVSLVPKWKDDGDDSVCGSIIDDMESYEIRPIPSTLEFVLTEGETGDQQQSHASPSSLSDSHHSSRILRIDMVEDGLLPPPISSIHSNRDSLANDGAPDTTCTKQRSRFRRRLNNGSIGTNPLSESQSSSPSLASSAQSLSTFLSRSRQRFVLMFGAFVLVMLSTHDSMRSSRHYYRQQDLLSAENINIRREEIAFPLEQELDATHTYQKSDVNYQKQKADLPKFYFPKAVDPNSNNKIRGSASAGGLGSNLIMARPHPARPLFVPDTPLPDGGFKKPLERFVYDSNSRAREQDSEEQRRPGPDSFSPWTSWIASLVLISMLLDTGRKEYKRHRLAAISSSRDE